MVIAVVLVVLGYLGTIIGVWQSIQRRNAITYIASALILSGAAGVIWITLDASKGTDHLKAKSDEITKLNHDLLAKSDEATGVYKKLALSNEQLTKKSEELLKLSRVVATRSEQNAELNRKNLAQTLHVVELVTRLQKQEKIPRETAQEILETLTSKASAQISIEEKVIRKPSPSDKMDGEKNK